MSNDKKTNGNKYSLRDARFYNTWRRMFQFLVTHVFYMIRFKLVYRLEIYGKENIPSDNNFIVAANHLSTLDPPLVCGVMNRGVAYMAKKELFEESLLQTLCMDWLGAFAVNREKLEVSTIKTVKEVYKSSWMLGIFPEGGIRKNKTIEKINKGFAVISKAAKWDILPVSITGCEKYNWIPFKGKIIVKIGRPISHKMSQDEIMEHWGCEVAKMSGYDFCSTESDNLEEQDQREFSEV